jgi:hypothetical protein
MSFFPSLHKDDVSGVVQLKSCERCRVLFTRSDQQPYCGRCLHRFPWLADPGTVERTWAKPNGTSGTRSDEWRKEQLQRYWAERLQ